VAPEWRREGGPGFAVYVHWPFCASKCPYCDFNSHVRQGGIDEPRFLKAYLAELRHMHARAPSAPVRSVFFGGGTPSLMQPETVGTILEEIASLWPNEAGAEITLEANPGSVEAGRLAGYRAAGVNRVSLGVQSLRDADLRSLGRLHSVAEARGAIEIARRTFERVSFDLIYARPGQTESHWREELNDALALGISHLSLYQLTIEEGTPFAQLHAAGRLKTPPSEEAAALYELTQDLCEGAGLPAYEVSNHARPGEECRHNLVYWRYGGYAGIGPGAHGRLPVGVTGRVATASERNPERWLAAVERQGHGMVEVTPLGAPERADEMLIMGLRLAEGFDLARYEAETGHRIDARTIDALADEGLLRRIAPARIAPTRKGLEVLNRIVLELSSTARPAPQP
jgi:oxygen-independent coproporphyrinogen-3 oxidase